MTRLLFFLPLFLVLFVGCGESKPDGFPALVNSVSVKIVKGGQPLSDVSVSLFLKDSTSDCLVSGNTDAAGVAVISTSRGTYIKKGAPVGKYLVQLREVVKVDMPGLSMDATPAQEATWTKEYTAKLDAARIIPKALTNGTESPLEIEISQAPVAVEFDVSKY